MIGQKILFIVAATVIITYVAIRFIDFVISWIMDDRRR